jgi:glycosyltransferase involved in cell wall biosynthesis
VLLLLPWVEVGGADRFSIDLADGLRARNCRVTACLLRPSANPWKHELIMAAHEVFDLPLFLAFADYPRFLRYLVESRGITTVVVHNDLFAYRLLPFLRAWCPQVTVIDFLHIVQDHYHGGVPRAALEYRSLIDLHVAASHQVREWMVARGADPGRVDVCSINVDTQRWKPDPALRNRVRAELGLRVDEPVVLFVGRLVPQKRPRPGCRGCTQIGGAWRPLHLSGGRGWPRPGVDAALRAPTPARRSCAPVGFGVVGAGA